MRRLIRPATLLLLATFLLTGCGFSLSKLFRSDRPQEQPKETPTAQVEPPPPPPPPILAASVLPTGDYHITYAVTDLGQEPVLVEEDLVWDGRRLVAAYNGYAYANWILDDQGLWRPDPKGGGALLRYLPHALVDDDYWKQTSGDAEVFFRLRRQLSGRGWFWAGVPEQCWELTVLNRSERTTFLFVSGIGPTLVVSDNWATPTESFEKKATAHQAGELTEAQRTQLLGQMQAPMAGRAPVVPITTAEFEAAETGMMAEQSARLETHHIDLDGDGVAELVQAELDVWSYQPIHFTSADGATNLGTFAPRPQHRLRAVRLSGHSGQVFLYEEGEPGRVNGLTILHLRDGAMEPVAGWDPKMRAARGHRLEVTPDGLIAVEWDWDDPAGHTRRRTYRFTGGDVIPVATTFRPTGADLAQPSTHGDLTLAALVAAWFGLADEMPRYFMSDAVATRVTLDPRLSGAVIPGEVKLGWVTPPAAGGCDPHVAEAPVGDDGTSGFAATWGWYEACAAVWGTVTFATADDGRPLIADLIIEGHSFHSE